MISAKSSSNDGERTNSIFSTEGSVKEEEARGVAEARMGGWMVIGGEKEGRVVVEGVEVAVEVVGLAAEETGTDFAIGVPSGLTLEDNSSSPQSPHVPSSTGGAKRHVGALRGGSDDSSMVAKFPQASLGRPTLRTSNGFPSVFQFSSANANSFFTRQRRTFVSMPA